MPALFKAICPVDIPSKTEKTFMNTNIQNYSTTIPNFGLLIVLTISNSFSS